MTVDALRKFSDLGGNKNGKTRDERLTPKAYKPMKGPNCPQRGGSSRSPLIGSVAFAGRF